MWTLLFSLVAMLCGFLFCTGPKARDDGAERNPRKRKAHDDGAERSPRKRRAQGAAGRKRKAADDAIAGRKCPRGAAECYYCLNENPHGWTMFVPCGHRVHTACLVVEAVVVGMPRTCGVCRTQLQAGVYCMN